MALKKGNRIEYGRRQFDVLEVTEFGALVKPVAKGSKSFETATGEHVEFESSGRPFRISANAEVKVIK